MSLTKKQVAAIAALLVALLGSFGVYINKDVQDAAVEATCASIGCDVTAEAK